MASAKNKTNQVVNREVSLVVSEPKLVIPPSTAIIGTVNNSYRPSFARALSINGLGGDLAVPSSDRAQFRQTAETVKAAQLPISIISNKLRSERGLEVVEVEVQTAMREVDLSKGDIKTYGNQAIVAIDRIDPPTRRDLLVSTSEAARSSALQLFNYEITPTAVLGLDPEQAVEALIVPGFDGPSYNPSIQAPSQGVLADFTTTQAQVDQAIDQVMGGSLASFINSSTFLLEKS